jgi:CubicO group peptidase (beta-lactamase class C family)
MKRLFARLLVVAVVFAAMPPAMAQGVDAFDKAFQAWMQKNKVASATLAVAREGRLVLAKNYNGWKGESPGLLASLSKAVTAVCIGTLVDGGKLTFDSRVGDVLADYFRGQGEPGDPRIKSATVGQLLAHRAGFGRDGREDPATGANLLTYLKAHSAGQADMVGLLPGALRGKLPLAPGEAYAYTNAAYLILGVMIETVTRQKYEDYCRAAVQQPLKLGAVALDPGWRILTAFGGWAMTGPQYLTFLRAYDADSKVMGPATRKFLTAAEGKWINDQKVVFYSLGVNVRPATGGHNTWHHGTWRYNANGVFDGRLQESVGTFAVRAAAGASWFAAFKPHPGDEATTELDRELFAAFRAVKTWPDGDGFGALGLK